MVKIQLFFFCWIWFFLAVADESQNTTAGKKFRTKNFRGPLLIQAFGNAPNAPLGTPQKAQINITWLPFRESNVETNYTLVRSLKGNDIDLATIRPCQPETMLSCQVCRRSGAGPQTCLDENIIGAPQVFDYAVAEITNTDTIKKGVADVPVRMTVPVPPPNMVLVERSSVNYEQCQLLGRESDPLNHQRCRYKGLGQRPENSNPGGLPLNLPKGFFDMGYSYFVDRWITACRWSPVQGQGHCGAKETPGDCFGNTEPLTDQGIPGNVFYRTDTAECFYKRNSGTAWIAANDKSLSSDERSKMSTSDPDPVHKAPPLALVEPGTSWDFCQSKVDLDYGKKRLPRSREFRAFAAWAHLPGEPQALTLEQIQKMQDGSLGHGPDAYSCNSNYHQGVAAGPFNSTELAGDSSNVIHSFVIGSLGTSRCVSRFGVQDHVGNIYQWVSDQLSCHKHTCQGQPSTLDSGNGGKPGFDLNGYKFDGIQGPGGTSAQQGPPDYTYDISLSDSKQSYGTKYFNTVLGVPLITGKSDGALSLKKLAAQLSDSHTYLRSEWAAPRSMLLGGCWGSRKTAGRWTSLVFVNFKGKLDHDGFRCVLPAE